jgi:hypothetical protein
MPRTVEITIETERVTSVTRRLYAVELWCDECGKLAIMITADQAAAVSGCGLREVFRRLSLGLIHFSEEADGQIWICISSLGC